MNTVTHTLKRKKEARKEKVIRTIAASTIWIISFEPSTADFGLAATVREDTESLKAENMKNIISPY